MRKVVVYDRDNDRFLELITNNFEWSAATVAQLNDLSGYHSQNKVALPAWF